MKLKLLRTIKFILGWPLIIAAIFFIGHYLKSASGSINLAFHINIALLFLGIFFFMLYFFIRSYFWREILRQTDRDVKLTLKESSFLWAASEIKRFVPGSLWSFLGRTMAFSEKKFSKKTIITLLLIESEFLVIGGLGVSLWALPFIFRNFIPENLNTKLIYSIIFFISFALSLLFVISQTIVEKSSLKKVKIIASLTPNFPPKTNLRFLLISYIYSAVFGIGTYLTVSSVISINPSMFTELSGFFVFAFVVGYLSIVTPMGLGVREAVLTAGLAKIISLDYAGFGAVYARIVLITAELILLLMIFLWRNTKHKFIAKAESFIASNKQKSVLFLLVVFYILYFTTASFLRYQNYYTGRFDLGNMDQTVWNSLHGRIFQLTDPNGTNITSRLSYHADFILILLAPFYLLWQDPRMLLLLQTVIIALGAFFIFNLSEKVVKDKNIAFILSLGYLLYPPLNYANLYDFHPVALATTFLMASFYFLYEEKYTRFIIFALLAGLTKEEIWLTTSLMGLYALFIKKKKILGLIVSAVSIAVFYYLIWIAIPTVRGSEHFALSYYSDFGQSPGGIIKNVLLEPEKTIGIILQKNRIFYLLKIFSPLGFIPLLSPLLLFSLPDLVLNLLSSNASLHQIYYQYTSAITPFVFISAVFGIRNLKKLIPKIPNYFYAFFLTLTVFYTSYLIGPMPWSKNPNIDMFILPVRNRKIIDNFISDIPQKYTIAATNNLGSHLSHRQKIFTVPVGIDKADIIMFLLNDKYARPSLAFQKKMAAKMKRDKKYIEVFKENDFIVFEKRDLYLKKKPKIRQAKLFPLSIPALSHRDYIGGKIRLKKLILSNKIFKAYDAAYPSDGLTLPATINIPNRKPLGTYPVLIISPGYQNPKKSNVLSAREEAFFASNGFLVIEPKYISQTPKFPQKALSFLAYPIDLVNLLSSLKTLNQANPKIVYLLGRGFGGSVILETLEIAGKKTDLTNAIKAAVLEYPVINPLTALERSSDPYLVSLYNETVKTIGAQRKNPLLWQSLEPLSYLINIKTPILIEHGTADKEIPYQNSIELYDDLLSLNKNARLILYENANHNLSKAEKTAQTETLNFFKDHQ